METPEARIERRRVVVIEELQFQLQVIRLLNQKMMVVDYRERCNIIARNPGVELVPDRDDAMDMFMNAERNFEEVYTTRLEEVRTAPPSRIDELYVSVRRWSADVDGEFRRMYLEIVRREERLRMELIGR